MQMHIYMYIYSVIRRAPLPCPPKQPKNLDLSYKTDLDFCDCFGKKIYILSKKLVKLFILEMMKKMREYTLNLFSLLFVYK